MVSGDGPVVEGDGDDRVVHARAVDRPAPKIGAFGAKRPTVISTSALANATSISHATGPMPALHHRRVERGRAAAATSAQRTYRVRTCRLVRFVPQRRPRMSSTIVVLELRGDLGHAYCVTAVRRPSRPIRARSAGRSSR